MSRISVNGPVRGLVSLILLLLSRGAELAELPIQHICTLMPINITIGLIHSNAVNKLNSRSVIELMAPLLKFRMRIERIFGRLME